MLVLSDHKKIQYFATTKQLTRHQDRWSEYLSGFNYLIQYHAGCLGTNLMLSLVMMMCILRVIMYMCWLILIISSRCLNPVSHCGPSSWTLPHFLFQSNRVSQGTPLHSHTLTDFGCTKHTLILQTSHGQYRRMGNSSCSKELSMSPTTWIPVWTSSAPTRPSPRRSPRHWQDSQ